MASAVPATPAGRKRLPSNNNAAARAAFEAVALAAADPRLVTTSPGGCSPAEAVNVTPGPKVNAVYGRGPNMNRASHVVTPNRSLYEFGAPGKLPSEAAASPVALPAPLKAPEPAQPKLARSLGSTFNNAALAAQQAKINAATAEVRAGAGAGAGAAKGGRRHKKHGKKSHKKSHKKHGKKSHKKRRSTRRVRFDRI